MKEAKDQEAKDQGIRIFDAGILLFDVCRILFLSFFK